ncbi:S8 family serine peptidase [Roseibium sp.]|uniref:S8 family serine peptidase n=1 Tax=Roseibium sp. TaxID=1936156 RepID=UPI0039EF59FA
MSRFGKSVLVYLLSTSLILPGFAPVQHSYAQSTVSKPSKPAASPKASGLNVEFSDLLEGGLEDARKDAKQILKKLKDQLERGITELAKTNKDAKALVGSGQTIRIICFGSNEAKKLGLSQGGLLSPGETSGKFDDNGRPIKGATAVIAIDCEKLALKGLKKRFYEEDKRSTIVRILAHELLHASGEDHTHDKDGLTVYKKFVDAFDKALRKSNRDLRKKLKAARKAAARKKQAKSQSNTKPAKGDSVGFKTLVPAEFKIAARQKDVCVGETFSVSIAEGWEEVVVGQILAQEGLVIQRGVTEVENPDPTLLETVTEASDLETAQSGERQGTAVIATTTEGATDTEEEETDNQTVAALVVTETENDTGIRGTLVTGENENKVPVPSPKKDTETTENPVETSNETTTASNSPPTVEIPEPDLGLVKASINVDYNAGSATEGTVIKLVSDAPPFPFDEDIAALEEDELIALEDIAELEDGELILEDGELGDFAELEADPIGNDEFPPRGTDPFKEDVSGTVATGKESATLVATSEVTNLLDESVILEIAKRTASGEIPVDAVELQKLKDRLYKDMMRNSRFAKDILEEEEKRRKAFDKEFEEIGKLGLDFKVKPDLSLRLGYLGKPGQNSKPGDTARLGENEPLYPGAKEQPKKDDTKLTDKEELKRTQKKAVNELEKWGVIRKKPQQTDDKSEKTEKPATGKSETSSKPAPKKAETGKTGDQDKTQSSTGKKKDPNLADLERILRRDGAVNTYFYLARYYNQNSDDLLDFLERLLKNKKVMAKLKPQERTAIEKLVQQSKKAIEDAKKYREDAKKVKKVAKTDPSKQEGMGGTTDIQAPTEEQLKKLKKEQEEEERRKLLEGEDNEELGEGDEILMAAPVPDDMIFERETRSTIAAISLNEAGEAVVEVSLTGDETPRTKRMIVSLDPLLGRDFDRSQLGEIGLAIASYIGDATPVRSFMVGPAPVFVLDVSVETYEETRQFLNTELATLFVEGDPCRIKENDPYYEGSGLWGQDFENQWAIKRVGFSAENNDNFAPIEPADPVVVAVIDSGIDWFHPDLPASSLWRNPDEIPDNGIDDDGNGYIDDTLGWNFVANDNKPWDQDGHGTFVSGVIAAGQNNEIGIKGISSNVRIMPLKALDAFGQGHASMVAEAITYAANNGARVINLSLGGRNPTDLERIAITHAAAQGALVVAAAGNQGAPVADYAPAGLNGVLTVSATDRNDNRAGFSNFGPAVDIAAPGVDVLSLRARNTDLLSLIPDVSYQLGEGIVGEDRAYYRASGTSFATPIAAGAAAVLFARNPELAPSDIKRMLINSARDIETEGIDNFTGYGLLDVAAAAKADPAYFVSAQIDGVRVVKVKDKQALLLTGTADADRFAGASLFIGQGEEPTKWFKVKTRIEDPKTGERLLVLPAKVFAKAPKWTLKLVVDHEDGSQRQATFALSLG